MLTFGLLEMPFVLRCTVYLSLIAALPALAAPSPTPSDKRFQACTTCHGKAAVDKTNSATSGNANKDYIPRIAGKPAPYLYSQLLNFRERRRQYKAMNVLVEHLSDQYLFEMAQYFERQQLPYERADIDPNKVSAQVLARGEVLVRNGDPTRGIPACQSCHGVALTGIAAAAILAPNDSQPSKTVAVPGLIGLPKHYVYAQLGAWQLGQRKAQSPDCMSRISKQLSGEDMAAVSTWLAVQPIPANTQAFASLPTPMPEPCGGSLSQTTTAK
jgi:cytochrome c553